MKLSALAAAVVMWLSTPTGAEEPLMMDVMTFDGKSGYVELPQNLFDDLVEGTVETWVKWDKFNKWSRVFEFGEENRAFSMQTEKDKNTVNFRIWEKKRKDHKIQAKKKLVKGKWHHVAAVFGRSGMAFYLDGELVGTHAFEGGLDVAAGGNNYIGKSNWPKDKLFRGQMAEFRVWDRRLSPPQIHNFKDRTLPPDEPGLIGYWKLGDAVDGEVPSGLPGGYAARVVGSVSVASVPAISRFLVPGELEKEAASEYAAGTTAFEGGDYESATRHFATALHLVRDYEDAREKRDASQHQWNLKEATRHYAAGDQHMTAGDAIAAYWAFDRAIEKVADFQDAASRREEALQKATYRVGLFLLSSDNVRASLTPPKEEKTGWGKLKAAINEVGRHDLLKKPEDLEPHDSRTYEQLMEAIEKDRAPYLSIVPRDEMRSLLSNAGVNAANAHPDQVIDACRAADIPVVVLGEWTEAYTLKDKESKTLKVVTTKKQTYTDSEGKKKKRDVLKKSYTVPRVKIRTEMSSQLAYRIVDVSSGKVVADGLLDAADSDKVDYINWNNYDGVPASSLRVRDGKKFKKLSRDERRVMDADRRYKTTEGMLNWGAGKVARDLASNVLTSLKHYSPSGDIEASTQSASN